MTKALTIMTSIVVATALSAGAASADLVDYSTDFAGSPFTEGGDLNGVDGWVANTNSDTVNVTTNGQFSILANGSSNTQVGAGGSFAVGDTVTLSAEIFYNTLGNNANFRLGLSDGTDVTNPIHAGTQFRANAAAGNLIFNGFSVGGSTTSSDIDTGVDAALNTNYIYTTTITKSATPNEFDVSWSWSGNAVTDSFTITNATLYNATDVYGTIQYNGPTTPRVIVDAYSQSVTSAAIPEPTSLGLIGLGCLGLLARRRH